MVGEAPREVSADQPLPSDLQEGDIVTLGGFGIMVPARGVTVRLAADNDDGTVVDLVVENPIDGIVRLVEAPEPVTGPVRVTSMATTNKCNDGAYNLEGTKWDQPFEWWFYADSTPAANNKGNVAEGLQFGANGITNQRNNCGLADQVSATNVYNGATTSKPNMTSTTTAVTCGNGDGKNVVGFGTLPTSTLAITCLWSGGATSTEADIRFNAKRAWYALAVPAGCSSKDGIEPVATHEFGHVFGLAHVSQSAHPELTMAPLEPACTNSHASLGLGDIRGLRAMY